MGAHIEEELISEYVEKIHLLGIRALYGDDVGAAVYSTVNEACYYMIMLNNCNPTVNLRAFRKSLQQLADTVHKCSTEYEQVLNGTILLISLYVCQRRKRKM
ncbi:hypothetical protein [Collimonas pratensis]|uniref:hypothetical protein n=1 Tax=Collimonas pratensis TaxID=279113 RepID=UPI000781DA04|nr:hypothetical protein [Collimonas pratensis]